VLRCDGPSSPCCLSLIAAACGGSDEVRTTYYQDAARLTSTYEAAAGASFDTYRAAPAAATEETGDTIFVEANQALFTGLELELGTAVSDLTLLVRPGDLENEHAEWVVAAQALYLTIQEVDDTLTPLTDPDAVDEILSALPLADLQAAYRSTCRVVRELGSDSDDIISCEPADAA